ncbi:hypothetical protein ACHAWF_012022 [Thalassiosira exigua]
MRNERCSPGLFVLVVLTLKVHTFDQAAVDLEAEPGPGLAKVLGLRGEGGRGRGDPLDSHEQIQPHNLGDTGLNKQKFGGEDITSCIFNIIRDFVVLDDAHQAQTRGGDGIAEGTKKQLKQCLEEYKSYVRKL